MTGKAKLRHYLEALLIYVLPISLRPLPFRWRVAIGGALVGAAVRWLPVLRRRITHNLNLVLPARAKDKALIRQISRHIGRGFMILFYCADYHRTLRHVDMPANAFDDIKAAQAEGRPVIVLSGHFGEWEAIRVMLRRQGLENASIYRESRNPIFERHHRKALDEGGGGLFPTGMKGTRKMLRHLRNGGIMTVLLDQRVDDGVPLDFLGRPALTSLAMAELALKTGALMVPAYALSLPGGRVRISAESPIPHSTPEAMMQAVNDSLSAQVRAHPEQWYWLHYRWNRPQADG